MSFFLNVLWFLLGGFISGLCWILAGIIWCITIVGVPVGLQCFKFATLSFAPFGKEIKYGSKFSSLVLNIFWIIITGVPMAIEHFVIGLVLCCTLVGFPWGLQHFKIAKLAFAPFGAEIVKK